MKKKFIACILICLMLTLGFGLTAFCLQDANTVLTISPKAASDLIAQRKGDDNFVVLDIRTPAEFEAGHLPNSIMIDFYSNSFADELKQLDKTKTYLIYCRSGNRSGRSMELIRKLKFHKVYHMDSGIIGWESEGLPVEK